MPRRLGGEGYPPRQEPKLRLYFRTVWRAKQPQACCINPLLTVRKRRDFGHRSRLVAGITFSKVS